MSATLAPARTVNWYVPFTERDYATAEAAPRDAVWVDVSEHSTEYWFMLLRLWRAGETFAILEHDVICRPDVIEAFETCPEPWCAFGYEDICHPECMEAWANTLGCTRFRSELIQAVPDAVSSIEDRDWHNLCDGLGSNLRAAGFTHHWHGPWLEHTHLIQRGNEARSA